MKYILRYFLSLLISIVPIQLSANELLGNITMSVGETKTLYLGSTTQNILSYSHWVSTDWTTSNSSSVKITSKGKDYCVIQAVAPTSERVKIEYDLEIGDAYLNWVHLKDYYYVTVEGGKVEVSANPLGGEVDLGSVVKLFAYPLSAQIYYTLDGTTPSKNIQDILQRALSLKEIVC